MKADDSQLKLEAKGVWIPICIWDNKDLTLQEKAVLVKVESFKECFASNDYLAEFVNVSVSRIKQVLKSLEEKGYIFRSVHRKEKTIVKRVISVNKVKFYGIDYGLESYPNSDIGQEAVPSKDRKLSYPRAGNCPDNSKANNKDYLSSKRDDCVSEVFDFWKAAMDSPKSVLDNSRSTKIRVALKNHSVDDLKSAIRGCLNSAWNMGENPQKTKYNGIELILRNAGHIERFMSLDKPILEPWEVP